MLENTQVAYCITANTNKVECSVQYVCGIIVDTKLEEYNTKHVCLIVFFSTKYPSSTEITLQIIELISSA